MTQLDPMASKILADAHGDLTVAMLYCKEMAREYEDLQRGAISQDYWMYFDLFRNLRGGCQNPQNTV
jgi:hypothetical protein